MIYAFVAAMYRDEYVPLRGNGKTLTMVYYLYKEYKNKKRIITNFYTPFSEMMNITDIILGFLHYDELEKWKELNKFATDEEVKNYIHEKLEDNIISHAEIGLTEFQTILDNLGHKALKKRIWRLISSQSRKAGLNFYYDTQILKQIDNDARDHTDRIIIPKKIHYNGKECQRDQCDEKHKILVMYRKPLIPYPMRILKADGVGKLYDTNKITIDPIDMSRLVKYKHLFGDMRIPKKLLEVNNEKEN